MLLSLLTILLACTHKRVNKIDEVRRVEVVTKYEKCPAPEEPELKPLLEELHIGSKENINRIMENTVENKAYIKGLKSTIECYEFQAGIGE